jgi:hypothetical protein
MTKLTRDEMRSLFAESGLTYADLTVEKLRKLVVVINNKMKESNLIQGTYRCNGRVKFQNKTRFFAGLTCKSFYFKDREVVSFNDDGFIGFAGWSDDTNVQPILAGFKQWIGDLVKEQQ